MTKAEINLSMRLAKSIAKLLTEHGVHPHDASKIAAEYTKKMMAVIDINDIKDVA